jgi:hypothetical protein
MKAAYDAAFAAHKRCTDLLTEHHWSQIDSDDVFEQFGLTSSGSGLRRRRPTATEEDLERIYSEAQAEDLQADYQASIVLLFADDALQRFAKGVLGNAPGLTPGYGSEYGTHRGTAKFTTLLRAGTNAIRHVSEWDDYDWPRVFGAVYPTLDNCTNERERQDMSNIVVFQNVFGFGFTERIRDVQSMNILARVDGRLGTERTKYEHFEEAMVEAAREIAVKKGGTAPQQLKEEI